MPPLLQGMFLALLAFVGFQTIFSVFQPWDDEGYFLLALRRLLDGQALYEAIPNGYGPFYFAFKWLLHGLLRAPVTHDAIRLTSLACWVATCALLGITLQRLGSWLIARLAELALLITLSAICNEPGHPQELVMVLLAGMLCLSAWSDDRPSLTQLALLGAGCGAIAGCKINLGIFAIAACGMTIVSLWKACRTGLALRVIASLLAVATPLVLMRPRLADPGFGLHALVVVLAMIPLLAFGFIRRAPAVSWLGLSSFCGGLLLCIAGCVAFALACHASFRGVAREVLVGPARMGDIFAWPINVWPPVAVAACVIAVGSLVVGTLVALQQYRGSELPAWQSWAILSAKLVYGAGALCLATFQADAEAVLLFTALSWLILVPPARAVRPHRTARTLLAWMSVMQTMWVYPVAGSQVAFASALPTVVGALCLSDALEQLRPEPRGGRKTWFLPPLLVGIPAAIVVIGFILFSGVMLSRYQANRGTALRGASLLRLPASQAAEYELLAAQLHDQADTFLCTDGFNSLYFWAEKPSPIKAILSHHISSWPQEQQRQMIDELYAHPKAWFVRQEPFSNPGSYVYFNRLVDERFRPRLMTGTMLLMSRRGRPLPPLQAQPSVPARASGSPRG